MKNVFTTSVFFAFATISIPTPALAQTAEPADAPFAMDPDDPPILEEGLWLRAEVGYARNTVHRERDGQVVDQTISTDSPAWGLRLGYAPARWVAIGFVGDLAVTRTDFESSGAETHTNVTTALTGAGARVYPFDMGFSFELAGGWSFAYLNDGSSTSLMMGPGFSASLGLDGRIFQPRNSIGERLGENAASQLFGVALRLDVAPSVKGDDYDGHAYSLAFALAATL